MTTLEFRYAHSSAVTSEGVLLLGGYDSRTTEVIPATGAAAVAGMVSLSHGYGHCTVQLSDGLAVLSGGHQSPALVTEYDLLSGEARHLPELREGRRTHACSWYHRGHDMVGHTPPSPLSPGPPGGRRHAGRAPLQQRDGDLLPGLHGRLESRLDPPPRLPPPRQERPEGLQGGWDGACHRRRGRSWLPRGYPGLAPRASIMVPGGGYGCP